MATKQNNLGNIGYDVERDDGYTIGTNTLNQPKTPDSNPTSSENEESQQMLEDIAEGNVENVPGSDLQAESIDTEAGITQPDDVEQMEMPTPVEAPEGTAASNISQAEATAAQAQTPDEIAASVIDNVAQVDEQAPTEAVQGEVSDEAIAEADLERDATEVEEVTVDTSGDEVTAEAAIGQMSTEAIAEAAQVAGVEVTRISTAKKQLRNAGLSEDEISELGNNPETLEARLLDFTEEQRGVIGGIPEEALVSTQMNALLEGLDSGEVPSWARPAVDAVESLLVRRGMSASTVGRDTLFNAIISAALPIAQSNAQSITQGALQQNELQNRIQITNAQMRQQATLQNAQNAFNLDLTNLNNEQQANLANSKFFQTVKLQNASNKQQAAIQNAVAQSNLDMAALDWDARLAAQNAQSFLQMDLTNLNNEQQALIVDTQFEQQRLLSNASMSNAAKQFNAQSENQTKQFMTSLEANIQQFNAQQLNAMETFNAAEANKIAAQNANNEIAVAQFEQQLILDVDKFNSTQELAREQWNAANAQAVEQSNVQWRRQANTADTAAQNAINQQNVQNAFQLTSQAQAALWQELRDAATFDFQGYENEQNRRAQLYATAIGNESAAAKSYEQSDSLVRLAETFFS